MDLEVGTKLICKKDVKLGCKSWNGNPLLFYKGQECEVLFKMNPKLAENSYGISNPQSITGHTIISIEKINEYFNVV